MVSYIEQDESGKVISAYEKDIVRHRNDKGQLHRENGPAVEWPEGTNFWYRNGRLHREDGPAIEWETGKQEWYLNGKHLTEQEFHALGSCDRSR